MGRLVRDKIPERIRKNDGIEPNVRNLNVYEYRRELRRKLCEEALEVQGSANREELIEELADVAEVMRAICIEFSISSSDLTARQEKKRKERGGFSQRFYLEE